MSSWMFLLYMPSALSLLGGTVDFGKSKSRNELNSSGEKLEGLGRPRNTLKGKINYSLKIPSCFYPTPDCALLGNMRENSWEVVRNHWLNTLHPRRGEMESGDARRAPGEMKDWYVRTQIYCGTAKSIHQEWGPRLELGKIEVYLERPGIGSGQWPERVRRQLVINFEDWARGPETGKHHHTDFYGGLWHAGP